MDWRVRAHRRRAFNEPGHAHELTFTCFRRFRFLGAERCCQSLAEEINKARVEWDFAVWAYVFMPEHLHLLIYPRQPVYDISRMLRAIKEPVAQRAVAYLRQQAPQWLPRIGVRHGKRVRHHFWQEGGGYDRNITEVNTLLFAIDYIHQNPVRRDLVARAEEWKWSSAGWYAGLQPNCLKPDLVDAELLSAVLTPWGKSL